LWRSHNWLNLPFPGGVVNSGRRGAGGADGRDGWKISKESF
jgi:hypothetical protein